MIKLELTKEEYKKLMDLVYIGDWVINSHRDENVLEEYEKIEDKIFSRASDAGFPEHADYDAELKEFFPSPKFDEEIHKYIDEYNDEVFWDESVNRLVERDLLKKYKNKEEEFDNKSREDRFKESLQAEEKYNKEFEENGIDNLVVK